ncbi:MAG: hypothetical protein WB646_04705, partial [Steroidobacteraceae bacterium]
MKLGKATEDASIPLTLGRGHKNRDPRKASSDASRRLNVFGNQAGTFVVPFKVGCIRLTGSQWFNRGIAWHRYWESR